ncbi:MAG: ABC transporter permease [Spirochaetes bacterium]|nr:ABC transporter permease [Spirochaetota bacterium]
MSNSGHDGIKKKLLLFLTDRLVWIILILILIFAFISSPIFRKPMNLTNVLKQSVGLGIAALGQTFVVLSGGIDLSIGSIISLLTTLIAGTFTNNPDIPMIYVILMILGIGVVTGVFNSFIVIKLNVAPFIATLGTMSIFQGIVLFYSKIPLGGVPMRFRFIADGYLSVIPFSVEQD